MEYHWPAGPATVPDNLAKPSSAYRFQAWLAMGGLALFVLLYFALTGWFIWTAYRLLSMAVLGGNDDFIVWLVGLSSGFLALFMLKALFFVKRGGETDDIQITPEEEPGLFAFLNRLADEAGAPRPHRVFLSSSVNASVFYDLSLLNLILPSKKNLEIGLALVNVLTLCELKAVLAHEFGHFGQKSMAVGRWVYIAQQIAAHIVAKRDALDKFLQFLSRVDIRIAWIGWLLSLVVWSIRSVLETAFSIVVMAQRALSREMEFQADRVAVSLTGSDALIHALHRLQAADEAWDRALNFVSGELGRGAVTTDIFSVQRRVMERMGEILHDPEYGNVPALPAQRPDAHRLFKADVAQPPRMWATHPLNHEREANAKQVYIPAPLEDRSAWEVFQDPQALKESVSAHLLRRAETEATPKAVEDSLRALDAQFDHEYLNTNYRGVYLGRSVVRHAARAQDLYDISSDAALERLDSLYPETLVHDLEHWRNLEREKSLLEALRDGTYTAPGGVIRHRGDELQRHELPHAIDTLREESEALQEKIAEHDRLCRSAHRAAAAARLGHGWEAYLVGLAKVLHYADHSEADLRDAQGLLANVVAVITADGRVSARELKRLLKVAADVYQVLKAIYDQSHNVHLDSTLAKSLNINNWQEGIGTFEFPPPHKDNINEWMRAVDSWIDSAAGALSALRHYALEQLLISEAKVSGHLRDGMAPEEAPAPSGTPAEYATLVPGSERELQKRLGLWDRFQTADGFFPSFARLLVSGSIVGAALVLGATI